MAIKDAISSDLKQAEMSALAQFRRRRPRHGMTSYQP
jgi:hypothetical protein